MTETLELSMQVRHLPRAQRTSHEWRCHGPPLTRTTGWLMQALPGIQPVALSHSGQKLHSGD